MTSEMGLSRATDPDLSEVLDELIRREPIFHRPEFGTSRADYEDMTVSDFWEVGASGRRYSREVVLEELERRRQNPVKDHLEPSDFRCQELAPDLYLLTYTLVQDGDRTTRRSTIWRHTDSGWKIVFHQGTIVEQ
ncbi:MAG TPA: DUF4440 domain-containing protein [Bryobacteraceae bacterium]|nr:DUF4440 domain-containing protein [Bryobacteraceae bacterium]